MKHMQDTPLWVTTIKYWIPVLAVFLGVAVFMTLTTHGDTVKHSKTTNVQNIKLASSSSSSDKQELPPLETSVENYIRTFSSGDVRALRYTYTANGNSLNITYTDALATIDPEERLNIIGNFFTSLKGHPHGTDIKLTVYVDGTDSLVAYMDFNKYEDYVTGQKVGW